MAKVKTLDDIITLITDNPNPTISLAELVEIHKRLSDAGKLADVVKKHIINALQNGERILGYKLVKSKGKKGITDTPEAVRRLIEYFKEEPNLTVEIVNVLEPVSLDKLGTALGSGVVETVLSGLISYNVEGKSFDFAPLEDERAEVKL